MAEIDCIGEVEKVIVATASDMFAAAENGGGKERAWKLFK